jgi:phosphoglycolate phosphatase-like HAD superfamily hydrolase
MPEVVVWFDIDGTLLDTGGAGSRAYGIAVRRHFGIEVDMSRIHFSGATDLGVLEDILTHHGQADRLCQASAFFESLESAYDEAFTATPITVFEGVRALLQDLDDDANCLLGLVTGNAKRLAYNKLRHVQLDHHFDHGGFGDDDADRKEMARLAHERAHALNRGNALSKTYLVGDTPRDISAAHAIGAMAIGVATGGYDAEALLAAGADVALESLADTEYCITLFTNAG